MGKQWKRNGVLVCFALGLSVADVGMGVTLTPENPTDEQTFVLQALESAVYDIHIASSGQKDGKTYNLKSSGVTAREGPTYFIWRAEETSTTHYKFSVANTHLVEAQTHVRVECVWVAESEEGGGSGGGVDKIEGWADGTAKVESDGPFWVEADQLPAVAPVGSSLDVTAYAGNRNEVESDWSKDSGVGDFDGKHTEISSISFKSEEGGYAVVIGAYCANSDWVDTESLTFVEVVSISADPAVVCVGSAPSFTVETSPAGYPELVNITFDSSTPGPQEAVATCGSSSASTWVTVVKLEINEPVQVTRGENQTLSASLYPSEVTPSNVVWIFTGGKGGSKNTGQSLSTSVVLVDGDNPYTVKCRATIQGVDCEDVANIAVIPRNGWTTIPSCDVDNDVNFGEGDFPSYSFTAGRLRNRILDNQVIITPIEGGFACAQVDDPNGPNDGYWYIESTTLEIDMETVINKYIKPGTVPPDEPGTNWHEYNESMSVDADGYLEGLNGHEFRGVADSGEGHFAYLEAKASEP